MVTIGDIIEDVNPFTEKGAQVVILEVIPRKILTDVIADIDHQIKILKGAGIETRNLEKLSKDAKARLEEFEGKQEGTL